MLVVVVVVSLSILVTPDYASAQTPRPAAIEILNVRADASGSLNLALRTDIDRSAQLQSMTLLVDDFPIALDVAQRSIRKDLAMALLIDCSGSMAGASLSSALDASRQLVQRLPGQDRISLISFADRPVVRTSLSADHMDVLTQISTLRAQGATALFSAVDAGAGQFTNAGGADRVMVLLSDGQDSGDPNGSARAESLRRVQDSGITVYTVGVGADYDESFLRELADATKGQFFAVPGPTNPAALSQLFTELGARFAATETYSIPLPALKPGTHRLTVRGRINNSFATSETTFNVSYQGLFEPSIQPNRPGDKLIVLLGGTSGKAQGLTVTARVDGQPLPLSADRTAVEIDPWQLQPGAHTLELTAVTAAGELAQRDALPVTVPTLAPLLRVIPNAEGVLAEGSIQGVKRPLLVAKEGGREVMRGEGQLALRRRTGRTSIELLTASGERVANEDINWGGAASSRVAPVALIALGGVALTGVFFVLRRRRGAVKRPSIQRIGARPTGKLAPPPGGSPEASTAPPSPAPLPKETPYGTLTVREPNGDSMTINLTNRPLTVGSSSLCGLVLRGPEMRPEHLRISRLSEDEVQMHVLKYEGGAPYAERTEDEWLIVHSGEEVLLGGYRLRVALDPDSAARTVEEAAQRDVVGAD